MSVTQDQRQLARNRVETLVRAMFAIKGLGEPDPKFILPIVDKAEAHLSQREMHHPDNISLAAIGDIQSIVAAAKTPPPTNIYGSDGARKEAVRDGAGTLSDRTIDAMDRLRGISSNGRYREASNDDGDGARGSGGSTRLGGDYQLLDLSSPQGLQQLSAIGWGSTAASLPFARAGLSFGTVKDLRNYDRNFTGQDVLKAAGDVKQLGFDTNDKRAMRNQATIRHYDNDADATTEAEKRYKHGVESDKDLQELLRQRGLCTDPVKRKAFDAQIAEHNKQHLGESGLQRRMDDPKNHLKARAAIKDFVDETLHDHHKAEVKAEQKAEVGARATEIGKAIKPQQGGGGQTMANAQANNLATGKKLTVATLSSNDQDDWGASATPAPKAADTVPKAADVKAASVAKPEPQKPAPTRLADVKPAAGPKPA